MRTKAKRSLEAISRINKPAKRGIIAPLNGQWLTANIRLHKPIQAKPKPVRYKKNSLNKSKISFFQLSAS